MSERDIFLGLVTLSAAKLGYLALCRNAKLQKYEKVGTVKSLNLFPLKSGAGIGLKSAVCTTNGLNFSDLNDRHWMIVKKDGHFLNPRSEPKLVLIKPSSDGDKLCLDAPGMPTLVLPKFPKIDSQSKFIKCKVWEEYITGLHCGEEAAKWIQAYSGVDGTCIVVNTERMEKRDISDSPRPWGNNYKLGDTAAFPDASPYMILSEASVEELNSKIEKKVTTLTFRPNITVEGCAAFDEDNWSEIRIGDKVCLRVNEFCPRCMFVNIDPFTGVKDTVHHQPYKTLQSFRTNPEYGEPCFGVYAALDVGGEIKVGDSVYVIRK